jgi:hypothetical protein
MQNLGTLRQLFLGDLADDGREEEEEEEEKIMPSLMATSLRWRTHSARTNNSGFTEYIWYECQVIRQFWACAEEKCPSLMVNP